MARANTLNASGAGLASTSCKVVLSKRVDDCLSSPGASPCSVVGPFSVFSLFHFSLFLYPYLSKASQPLEMYRPLQRLGIVA